MRLALLALLAVPQLADARPITVGLEVGRIQSKVDAQNDPNGTLGLWARIGLTSRLSTQLELQRITTDSSYVDIRTFGALLSVDLGSGAHLVPMLLGGVGVDHATYDDGKHAEAGFALEYRADGGLTLGGDLRIGTRELDTKVYYATPGAILYAPSQLSEGEYRSARLYVGVRF